jgi:hypothetical protein
MLEHIHTIQAVLKKPTYPEQENQSDNTETFLVSQGRKRIRAYIHQMHDYWLLIPFTVFKAMEWILH